MEIVPLANTPRRVTITKALSLLRGRFLGCHATLPPKNGCEGDQKALGKTCFFSDTTRADMRPQNQIQEPIAGLLIGLILRFYSFFLRLFFYFKSSDSNRVAVNMDLVIEMSASLTYITRPTDSPVSFALASPQFSPILSAIL